MLKAANDNEMKFHEFHEANPEIYDLIKHFAMIAIKSGREHYGMQSVIERVRWHTTVETDGSPYKVNNNHAAYYTKLFNEEFPQYAGFFRTRNMQSRSAA